jgi:hypothetical protein
MPLTAPTIPSQVTNLSAPWDVMTAFTDSAARTGSATGKDLLHTRLGYGECSRFIADPLLWKCG